MAALIRNPYLNRSMIRAVDEFYGRRRELQRILSRIGASTPQSVSLVGERRMGKSSLLWHLAQPEVHGGSVGSAGRCLFVLLDFQGHQHLDQAACCALLAQRVAEEAGPQVAAPAAGTEGLDALQATAQAVEAAGLRLVCLFDEFETVTRNEAVTSEFYGTLRSLANNHAVAFVTTSRRPLQSLCHSREISESPFFNIFTEVRVGPMPDDEVHDLITEPSAAAGVPLADHEREIRDLGGSLPFFLQIAASAIVECLAEGDVPDPARIDAAFLQEATGHFSYLWDSFDAAERAAMGAAARGRPATGAAAQSLQAQGYLVADADGVRPFSRVFASFLQRHDLQGAVPADPPSAEDGAPRAGTEPGARPHAPERAPRSRDRRRTIIAAVTLGLVALAAGGLILGGTAAPAPGLQAKILSPQRVRALDLSVEVQLSRGDAVIPSIVVDAAQPATTSPQTVRPGDRLRVQVSVGATAQVDAFVIRPDGVVGRLPAGASRPRGVAAGDVILLPSGDDWFEIPEADWQDEAAWQVVVVADDGRQDQLEELLLRYRVADAARRQSLRRQLAAEIHSRGAVAVTFLSAR